MHFYPFFKTGRAYEMPQKWERKKRFLCIMCDINI